MMSHRPRAKGPDCECGLPLRHRDHLCVICGQAHCPCADRPDDWGTEPVSPVAVG